ELPLEELGAEVERIVDPHPPVLPVEAVRALAGRRHEPFPFLARRLCEQLLGPEPEPARSLVDTDLVASLAPPFAELQAELESWVLLAEPTPLRHHVGALEQRPHIEVHERRRHDPERRERRVATADRRLARDDPCEAAFPRQLLELGAGIGDRGESASTRKEVVELAAGLERRAGLRGRDEERAVAVELLVEAGDRARMRRVEDVEALDAERAAEDLWREARAAHPEQDGVVEVPGKRLVLVEPLEHPARLVEPPEPLRLVVPGPDSRVARPDPVNELDRFERAHERKSRTSRSNSSGRSRLGTWAAWGIDARRVSGILSTSKSAIDCISSRSSSPVRTSVGARTSPSRSRMSGTSSSSRASSPTGICSSKALRCISPTRSLRPGSTSA